MGHRRAAAIAVSLAAGPAGVAHVATANSTVPAGAARSSTANSTVQLANGCFALRSGHYLAISGSGAYAASAASPRAAEAFYVKPTGLGTYMLLDRGAKLMSAAGSAVSRTATPGPSAEWQITPGFKLMSTVTGRRLTVAHGSGGLGLGPRGTRFQLVFDRGCLTFPEAQAGASGTPFGGSGPGGAVFGFADYHMHLTSSFRAGGRVLYGENFDPFGITVALGAPGDAGEHGPNGTLDVTGNLIRHGTPTGTHDPHGWPTFAGWPVHNTVTHQQIYWVWLERAWMAGLRLIVAQTVEDVELCNIEPMRSHSCDETTSIKLQIAELRALQDYIDAQNGGRGRGWLRLVYSPGQARSVIRRGKLAVVIGVESSNPLDCSERAGCTRADVDRRLLQYWRLGVRSVFIAHWVDNAFSGAAFQSGAEGTLLNGLNKVETGHYYAAEKCPLPGEGTTMMSVGHYFPGHDWISQLLDRAQSQAGPTYPPGPVCNAKGLTPLGAYFVHRMIAGHFLIEADHLSEKARESLLAIAAASRYPISSSHTGTGGFWPDSDLRRLYQLGGLATARSDTAPNVISRILSLRADRSPNHYFGVGLGTDTGGFNAQPGPPPDAASHPLRYPFKSYDGRVTFVRQQTGQRAFDLNRDGIAHYGLLADLIGDVGQEPGGRRALPVLFSGAEAYLEMWQRAWSR